MLQEDLRSEPDYQRLCRTLEMPFRKIDENRKVIISLGKTLLTVYNLLPQAFPQEAQVMSS